MDLQVVPVVYVTVNIKKVIMSNTLEMAALLQVPVTTTYGILLSVLDMPMRRLAMANPLTKHIGVGSGDGHEGSAPSPPSRTEQQGCTTLALLPPDVPTSYNTGPIRSYRAGPKLLSSSACGIYNVWSLFKT